MAETKKPGPALRSGMMHEGMKSADRVPMGVTLPKANMDFVRSKVGEDAPTIGPRCA
jgi:hypothetical protein